MITIDTKLILHVINITEYYIEGRTFRPEIDEVTLDVSKDDQLDPNDKSCNNMVLLNETLLMAFCKSK